MTCLSMKVVLVIAVLSLSVATIAAAPAAAGAGAGAAIAEGAVTPIVESLLKGLNELFSDKDVYRSKSDNYLLYEGNFCSQELAGSFWARRGQQPSEVNVKKVSFIQNDEARSVFIQGPISRGERLTVCDNPDNCDRDDQTLIVLQTYIPKGKGYCVNSFERSYKDPVVHVMHKHVNGLDGKVSRVHNK